MNWTEFFYYEKGFLFYRTKFAQCVVPGKRAGTIHKKTGYSYVKVKGKLHGTHRVIWEMFRGPIPVGALIDHIDGNPRNNALANLRLSDKHLNAANQKKSRGSSKYKGVTKNKSGSFSAYIKSKNLGTFEKEEDAAVAYNEAATALFGSHARLNVTCEHKRTYRHCGEIFICEICNKKLKATWSVCE